MSASTITTHISELLKTGRVFTDPANTKYVCHTSTIPLATTVDEQFLLEDIEHVVEVTHSIKYQPGYDESVDYKCCKKHCMFLNSKGISSPEFLRDNCPCSRVVQPTYIDGEEVDVYLQPLCFLQVLKESRYAFGYADSSVCDTDDECCHNDHTKGESNRPSLDMNHVMFCQNSQAVTDSRYSAPLRKVVGFDGWIAANNADKVAAVMNTVYWFRKHVSNFIRNKMSLAAASNFRTFKACLEQTLHTLNGVLCKKFLLFPCEMEGYVRLAKNTAELFEALMLDYLTPTGFAEPSEANSVFIRMKTTMKNVKRAFCSENHEIRLQALDIIEGTTKHCKFAKFFQSCVTRLRKRIKNLDSDYTTSTMWSATMSGFSQTRNLGYLPEWIAEIKRKEFRDNVGREKVIVSREKLAFIRCVVQERQKEMRIEPNFLTLHDRDTRKDFLEVINSIKLPLKPTASVRSTVYQGGKVEDARELLNAAMLNEWKVPVRNLSDGSITEWLQLSVKMREEKPEHEGYLFWISLQLVLNCYGANNVKYESYIVNLTGQEAWIEELWKMKIVHISEPGKERNLTKTSSVIAWVLTVASKVSQQILAYNQDHRAGLILSAQDWMHQRRVASASYESGWMYDKATRKRYPFVWNGFQDWKESTDFIPRQVGCVALAAWFQYVNFPRFYRDLVLLMTCHDYNVTEYTHTTWEEGVVERHHYNGKVTEGFMMSMPLTKTVLHLMHDVNVGAVHSILASLGIRVAPHPSEEAFDPGRDRIGQYQVRPQDTIEMR
jgi:hypothetical protein